MNFFKVAIVLVISIGIAGAIYGLKNNATEVEQKKIESSLVEHERNALLPLAKADDMEAMYKLGISYAQPSDVQDYEQARYWLKKAALLNHAKAQYYLGYMYAHGDGVEIDAGEATVWFWLAASNEERASRRYLKLMANTGDPEELQKARVRASEIWATMPNKDINKNKSALKYH